MPSATHKPGLVHRAGPPGAANVPATTAAALRVGDGSQATIRRAGPSFGTGAQLARLLTVTDVTVSSASCSNTTSENPAFADSTRRSARNVPSGAATRC